MVKSIFINGIRVNESKNGEYYVASGEGLRLYDRKQEILRVKRFVKRLKKID